MCVHRARISVRNSMICFGSRPTVGSSKSGHPGCRAAPRRRPSASLWRGDGHRPHVAEGQIATLRYAAVWELNFLRSKRSSDILHVCRLERSSPADSRSFFVPAVPPECCAVNGRFGGGGDISVRYYCGGISRAVGREKARISPSRTLNGIVDRAFDRKLRDAVPLSIASSNFRCEHGLSYQIPKRNL